MPYSENNIYLHALLSQPGIGARRITTLLRIFNTPREAYLSDLKYKENIGLPPKTLTAWEKHKKTFAPERQKTEIL